MKNLLQLAAGVDSNHLPCRKLLINCSAVWDSTNSKCLVQLGAFFARGVPLLVQVKSQIGNVYASGALLARLKAGDGQLDLPGQHLALEYEWREVREVVSAYLVE